MDKKIIAVAVLTTFLFVSVLAGTIAYYNGVLNDKNSQIASQNQQIAKQNSQISNLTAQITNLTSTSLATKLNVTEIPNISSLNVGVPFPTMAVIIPFDSLWINCSVTNTGHATAFNAGLQVIAFASDGTLEVNMTVPLVANSVYGTDSATKAFILDHPHASVSDVGFGSFQLGSIGSLNLGSLDSGQTVISELVIFHQGIVSNWTVTPIWTNTP